MKLYRVVFGEVFGDGFFHRRHERHGKGGKSVARLVNDHCRTYNVIPPQEAHDGPDSDPDLYRIWHNHKSASSLRFGFASLKQLRGVFRTKRLRKLLAANGCKIAVFNVHKKRVHMAKKQVMFDELYVDETKVVYHDMSFAEEAKYESRKRGRAGMRSVANRRSTRKGGASSILAASAI